MGQSDRPFERKNFKVSVCVYGGYEGVPGCLVQVRQTTKQVVVQRCGLTSDSQTARFSSVVLRLHVLAKDKV